MLEEAQVMFCNGLVMRQQRLVHHEMSSKGMRKKV
jgi:hypothetical protein